MKIKKASAKKSYSKWGGIHYQITPEGKKKAGLFKRFISGFRMGFDQLEVLNYLAQYKTSRSLEQIRRGINWQVTRAGLLKAVIALKRKGYIRKVI